MNNIIGLNTKLYGSNLNIAPAAESQEEEQVEETTPERVLNPIVSESYMRKYIEEHGGGSQKRYVTIQDTTTVNFSQLEEMGVAGEIANNSFAVYKFPKLDVTIDNEKKVYTFDVYDGGRYIEGEETTCIPEQTVVLTEVAGSGNAYQALLQNVSISTTNPPASLTAVIDGNTLTFEYFEVEDGIGYLSSSPFNILFTTSTGEWTINMLGEESITITVYAKCFKGTKYLMPETNPTYEGILLWGDFTEGTHTVKIQGYDETVEYVDGIQRNYIFKDVKFFGETSELSPAYAPVLNVIFDGVEYKNISVTVDGNNFIWDVGTVCSINFNYVQSNGIMSVWLADPEDTSEHTISAYYEGQELIWINMTTLDSEQYPSIVNGVAQIIAVDNETKLFPIPVVEYTYKHNILHYFDNKKANPMPSNGYVVGGQLLISNFNTGQISGAIVKANYIGGFTLQYFGGEV